MKIQKFYLKIESVIKRTAIRYFYLCFDSCYNSDHITENFREICFFLLSLEFSKQKLQMVIEIVLKKARKW